MCCFAGVVERFCVFDWEKEKFASVTFLRELMVGDIRHTMGHMRDKKDSEWLQYWCLKTLSTTATVRPHTLRDAFTGLSAWSI